MGDFVAWRETLFFLGGGGGGGGRPCVRARAVCRLTCPLLPIDIA
jgi:hypothetical protein